MPEALSTLATVMTIFSIATYAQDQNVDVYVNGNQIAQTEQHVQRQTRRDQIINEALERQQQILLANQRTISQTHLK